MDREALTPILRKTTPLPAEDAVHVCRAASQPHWAVCLWLRCLFFFFLLKTFASPTLHMSTNFCLWCKCDWLHSALLFLLLCQFVKCAVHFAPVFTSSVLMPFLFSKPLIFWKEVNPLDGQILQCPHDEGRLLLSTCIASNVVYVLHCSNDPPL